MASRIIYEWGTCTGGIRMLRFEIVNIEIMQCVFVINNFWRYWYGINIRNYRQGLILKIWWNFRFDGFVMKDIAYVNAIKIFVGKRQFEKKRLFISTFLIPTGLKRLWPAISKTIAVSLYSFEFGFVALFTKHELYKACSFESGSENSFERMWYTPNGCCINGRRWFSETTWNIRAA